MKKKNYPSSLVFNYKGVDFVQTGINIDTNLVTIKNIKTGKTKEIDYYKLKKILECLN